MTHEQHAKRFIEDLVLMSNGYLGPREREAVDKFFHHLKQAVLKDPSPTPLERQMAEALTFIHELPQVGNYEIGYAKVLKEDDFGILEEALAAFNNTYPVTEA